MRSIPLSLQVAVLLLLLAPAAAEAQSLRLVAADDRGVTLQLNLAGYELSSPLPDGRVELRVPGFYATGIPGRPLLPFAQVLVALPPGAGAMARVLTAGEDELREGVRVTIGAQPVMKDARDGFGPTPAREPVPPILDGPWPETPVEVGEPFSLRGQRIVAIQVRPFRTAAPPGGLWLRGPPPVGVYCAGGAPGAPAAPRGAPGADRHWEPVFRSALANYEQGRRWRTPLRPAGPAPGGSLFRGRTAVPAGTQGTAGFDENEPEVRIQVDTTGVYAFRYGDLATHGYPAGVPVDQVSLHRHEHAGPADPPYVTIELPIEVDDANGNGVFDGDDAIFAFVRNWVERSGVTSMMQRAWGDAEVVYATRLTDRPGRRVQSTRGWRDATLTPLSSYPATRRWERNFEYFAFPSSLDTAVVDRFLWTTGSFYYTRRPDTLSFEVNDLDTTRTISFRLLLQATDAYSRSVFGEIQNGLGQVSTVVDSTTGTWSGKGPLTVAVPLPGTAATEGLTNTLRLWGHGEVGAGGSFDPVCNARLNWFEATYWRSYRALGGYLDANSGDATGLFQVHADGFGSAALRVYDVTDSLPVRLATVSIRPADPGQYTVDFQDSTGAMPRRYVIWDSPKLLPSGHYSAVTRRHLTAASGEQDYLLIVPEAFLPAVAPLAQLRRDQGLGVVVAPLEAVNDEFNGGRKSVYAIKRFLRWALEQWNSRFVVLVGNGSVDGRHVLTTSGTDWVPIPLIPGPVSSGPLGLEMIPADPWYGWRLHDTPTPADNLWEPELYVGRLPVNTLEQANDVVAKLVAYEGFSAGQTWRRHMVLLADDCYSRQATFGDGQSTPGYCVKRGELVFRELNRQVQRTIALADSAGMTLANPELVDLRSYLVEPSLYDPRPDGPPGPSVDTCRVGNPIPEVRAEGVLRAVFNPVLFGKLNQGALWWNYQGHANQYVLSHEGFYRNLGGSLDNDRFDFQNDGKLFFFSAFSCHANGFGGTRAGDVTIGCSLGEDMVTLPGRGAVASWASTGYEAVPSNGFYHLNVEFARALFERPPHDDQLGRGVADGGARVLLGEAIALTMLNYLPTVQQLSYERGVGLTYNLLGDPATRLWVGPTQITVTANGVPVTSGEPVRLVSGGDTLRLEAELVSNVGIDSISVLKRTRSGTEVLPESLYALSPSFPDTLAGGAGGHRYHLTLVTSLVAGEMTYTITVRDRYGIEVSFDVVFQFDTQLYAGGVPVQKNDIVAPDAQLSLLVLSPYTLDPASLRLRVDGDSVHFDWEPARGDPSGRQFLLTWSHAPYADGTHVVRLEAPGAPSAEHLFRVVTRFALGGAYAFPNPFDDELGTRFVFTLTGRAPVDLLVRVFSASGRRVYETRLEGLSPGQHEIPWNGLDEEGSKLANGIYFYKLVAHSPQGTSFYDGRLVKLRRPRRTPDSSLEGAP